MNFFDHEGVGKRLKLIASGFQNSCGCFKFMFQIGIGLVIGDRGDVLSACPCSKCNRAQFGEQTERAASPLSRGSTPIVMTRTADLGKACVPSGYPSFVCWACGAMPKHYWPGQRAARARELGLPPRRTP
jgi:hypothetical protein